jgi:hypothetical protein
MSPTFFASQVAASDEEWGHLVLLGSIQEVDGQPYLMFQRSYESSPDDVRLGQDRPYVEIGNQGWSWYGHIESLVLGRDQLTLQMDQEAQNQMQNDGKFIASFNLDRQAFEQLRTKLKQVFESFPGFHENAV